MGRGCLDAVDDGGVNLPDLRQRPRAAVLIDCAQRFQKQRAVVLDAGWRVMLRLPEIECLAAVAGGDATQARAESVDQPGNCGERIGVENRERLRPRLRRPASLLASGGHTMILANAPVAERRPRFSRSEEPGLP